MKDELKAAYDAARVDPEALRILSVALSREDGCLTVEVERNARLAADDRLATWEREIRALIPAYTVSFVYREAAVVPVAPKPSKKKNEVEVPIPENGAIFGRPIPQSAENVSIFELDGESGDTVVFVGRLVSCELRDD